jgi:hypothetical protein
MIAAGVFFQRFEDVREDVREDVGEDERVDILDPEEVEVLEVWDLFDGGVLRELLEHDLESGAP